MNESNVSHNISSDVAKRAVEWLMEWQSADSPELVLQSITDWRQSNPEHNRAWLHIEKMNEKFVLFSTSQNSHIAHHTLSNSYTNKNISRRNSLKALSALFVAGGAGWLVNQQEPWKNWLADYQTAVGQQQNITLIDGTQVTLNTNTAIDINFTDKVRQIKLIKGEIYVKSGDEKTVNSPLIVSVAQGSVQPIGTRFSVQQLSNSSKVAVFDGKVKIQPINNVNTTILKQGSGLIFTEKAWSKTTVVSESQAAWTQGMMVVSDMRLDLFLIELNRYRHGIIQCAPEVANIKISGTYPINQAEKVLQILDSALPINMQFYSQYWLRVVPAS